MNVQRVAIIGAGPSGLAAAKYFVAEKAFRKIVIFEQKSNVGGVWDATPNYAQLLALPQTRPRRTAPLLETRPRDPNRRQICLPRPSKREAFYPSPVYDLLETNIPHPLMSFSDLPFPSDTQLFPKHQTVQEYLEQYASDVAHLVKTSTQITRIERTRSAAGHDFEHGPKWTLHIRDWGHDDIQTYTESQETFDAVVVANGHFDTEHVPAIPAISEWARKWPNSISHSSSYRRPEPFAGQRVLIIGNSASGADIASQIIGHCKHPLLISARRSTEFETSGQHDKDRRRLPAISSFDAASHEIHFADGQIVADVDRIIFCTGYLYSMPFLTDSNLEYPVITTGMRVENTYQHLFYAPDPTLSFLALPQKIIPFQVAEAQASVLARVYSRRLTLPPYEKMRQWEWDLLAMVPESVIRPVFHTLCFPKDVEYVNMLHDWAASAPEKPGLENGGVGKLSRRWKEWEYWCRQKVPEMKDAFEAMGDSRIKVTTLEQLGFDFEKWVSENDDKKENGVLDPRRPSGRLVS